MPGAPSPEEMTIRDARPGDLPALFKLTLVGLGAGDLATSLQETDFHPFHQFAMSNGRVLVGEVAGAIAGYGSVIEGASSRILSQLFVDEILRSTGIGTLLLNEIDPHDGRDRMLLATNDPRAIALYARRGYVPEWPTYTLQIPPDAAVSDSSDSLRVEPVDVGLALDRIDTAVSGRSRPDVHRYWRDVTAGRAYLLRRRDRTVGYGWIHDPLQGALRAWHGPGDPVQIGPVGAVEASYAVACVRTMVAQAGREYPDRGVTLEIGGPHPSLPGLLEMGARIVDTELAMSTNAAAFGDVERYLPSGGILY